MDIPQISVLMSVFNAAPYLRVAVDSILNQSFSDFEFILIEDGSTDQSAQILSSYADPRIILLQNERNIGLTRSLNRGLEIAQGAYIARMDADDIALPDRFSKQMAYLEQHPEIDVLGTQMEMITPARQNIGQYKVPTTHGTILWTLLFGLAIAHPTVFIRRDALKRVDGYSSNVLRAQDFDLWVKMSEHSRFANLPEILHLYRVQPTMISKMHTHEQVATLLRCRQQLFSRILRCEVPLDLVELTHRSQLKPSEIASFLTDEQILLVLSLIHTTYERLREQSILEPDEQEAVQHDMLERMMIASRYTAKTHHKAKPPGMIARLRRMLEI